MRRYIFLFTALTLFVIGCSEQTSINEPVNNANTSEPSWIPLPLADGLQVNQTVSNSGTIKGDNGGLIPLNANYKSRGKKIEIKSLLTFPKGCFSGEETFTLTHDADACMSTFGPAFVFSKKLEFSIEYSGLDLRGLNTSSLKFAYIAKDGSLEYAENDGIYIDIPSGTISVVNAKIPHFSRYGFVN